MSRRLPVACPDCTGILLIVDKKYKDDGLIIDAFCKSCSQDFELEYKLTLRKIRRS